MTRSRAPIDVSVLENDLRDALHQRAASTPITAGGVERARASDGDGPSPRWPRGRYVVGVAALAAAAAVVVALVPGGPTPDVATDVATEPAGPTVATLPEAEVPRLLVEPATLLESEGDEASLGQSDPGMVLQPFRQGDRVDGPMIFVTTLRPYNPATFGLLDDEYGDPVDVRGRVGYVAHATGEGGATTLAVELGDGDAIYVTAVGLTDAELVAFVNGLTPGPDGKWQATVAPQDVAEVPVALPPADGRHYGAEFDLPEVAPFELHLYQDGFESRLADRVASTDRPVEAVSVDGLPATLGAYDDTDWWVLLQPEPGRALELRIAGDRADVGHILSLARFVDEGTWDAATDHP